jgi:preprotein translocase subunit SecD
MSIRRSLLVACLAAHFAFTQAALAHSAQTQAPASGVQRLAFQIEVDREAARAAGWVREETSEAELHALAVRLVERRLGAMDRAAEVRLEGERIAVTLPSFDPRERELFTDLFRSMGLCEALLVCEPAQSAALAIDLAAERGKLDAWRTAHPGAPIAGFNALHPEEGGAHRRLLWVVPGPIFDAAQRENVFPLLLPRSPAEAIGAASFTNSKVAKDRLGTPSIEFDIVPARQKDFGRLTGAHRHQRLAMVVGDTLAFAPTLESTLEKNGLVEGRFSAEETARLVEGFTKVAGPLRVVEPR